MKKFIALAMALVMCLALFAGCVNVLPCDYLYSGP